MASGNWNLEAEQVTVGACLTSPKVILEVSSVVDPADFYRPAHGVIMEVIQGQYAAGLPADAVAVAEVLARNGDLARVGGGPYLHTLIASVPAAVNGAYYAGIVREFAVRRRVAEAGLRIAHRAEAQDADVADILAAAELDLAEASERYEPPGADVMDIAAFVATDLKFGDPVVPGLLDQQERIVVVAGEGAGKSELGIQAAVMTAAGLHVFTSDWIPPARTLIVDLENPSANVQRRAARMLRVASGVAKWDPGRCHIWSRPGGLDLQQASDARLLMSVITKANPALIVAGPAKKMVINRGESGDVLATMVTAFWDRVREKLGCALWLEHHAPLGQSGSREMRPINAALWTSWPEYGMGLYALSDEPGALRVASFRGHREERVWPVKLRRSQPWSWAGIYPEGTFTKGGMQW